MKTDENSTRAFLGHTLRIEIDRPQGSTHPTHGFLYPVNYGFVPGTISGDGEPIDAYVLGVDQPLREFTGTCTAIIHRLDDDDDKLIIAPQGFTFTNEEIRALTHFQEQFFTSEIWT
ncbi:MAG: inorganic diphosphatase [Anaerolineaceae bacterium]|nr:inorganic diphosphatase [Anaerolineaceae bacterium]